MKEVVQLCASFSKCANDSCNRHPTSDVIDKVRDGRAVAHWGDFHVPYAGLVCQFYKEPTMGAST